MIPTRTAAFHVAVVALLVAAAAAATVPAATDEVDAQQIRPGTTSGNSAEWRVSNPPSGSPFTIDGDQMSGYLAQEDQAGANIEAMEFRLRQGTGFDLALNYRPGSDPSTPEIAGVRPLTKVNITTDGISSDEIDEAAIQFAVRKSKLEELQVTGQDVVLYRLDGTTWEELNVAQIQERHDEFVYESRIAGFSWFAIGVRQPNFEVLNPYLGLEEIGEGEETTLFVKVFNDGSTTGTLPVTVTTDGTVLARENVTLEPDERQNLEIPISFDTLGEYDIRVNNVDAGTLRVVSADQVDEDREPREPPSENGSNETDGGDGDEGEGQPGFTALIAAVAAVGAAAAMRGR